MANGNRPYEAPCSTRATSSSGREAVTSASSVPTDIAARTPSATALDATAGRSVSRPSMRAASARSREPPISPSPTTAVRTR